jgi:hypothetical protein
MGISAQKYPGRDPALFGRYHQSTGTQTTTTTTNVNRKLFHQNAIDSQLMTHLLFHSRTQEVETEQFYNYFLPELKRDGYDGIFSPKSRAKTMAESDRRYVDGCAIFYRTAK